MSRSQFKPTIMKHDHVEGVVSLDNYNNVDRHFYLLETGLAEDRIWEADGYKIVDKDGQVHWSIIFICPKCNDGLRLDSQKKQFEITKRGIQTAEPLHCPNPHFEFGPCGWRGEFEVPNKDISVDYMREGVRGKVRLDALIRKV